MATIPEAPSTPTRAGKRKSLMVAVSQSAQSSTTDHGGSRPFSGSGAGLWLSSGAEGGSGSMGRAASKKKSSRTEQMVDHVANADAKDAAAVEAALLGVLDKENQARTPRTYHISPRLQGNEQAAIIRSSGSDGSVDDWEWKLRSETINASASGDVDLDLSFDFASQLETERRRRGQEPKLVFDEKPASPLSIKSINASPAGMASAKWTSRHRKEPPAPLPLFSKLSNQKASAKDQNVKSAFSPIDDAPLATTPLSATRRGVDSGLNALANSITTQSDPPAASHLPLQPSASQSSSIVDLTSAKDADEVSSIVRQQRQDAIERQQHQRNKNTKAKSNSVSPKKLKTKRSVPFGFGYNGDVGGDGVGQQESSTVSPRKVKKKGSVTALGENNNRHNVQMGMKGANEEEEDGYDFRKHLKKQPSVASSIGGGVGTGTGTAASFVTADGSMTAGHKKNRSMGRTRGNSIASTDTWKTAETKASNGQEEGGPLPPLPSFAGQGGLALGLFDGSESATMPTDPRLSSSTRVLLEPMSAKGHTMQENSSSPAMHGSDLSSPMTPFSALFSEPGTGRAPGSDFTHATAPPSEAAGTPASLGFTRLWNDDAKQRRASLEHTSTAMARAATTTSATKQSSSLQNNIISEEESVDRMTASAPAKAFLVDLPKVDTETWIRQQNVRTNTEDSNSNTNGSATSSSESDSARGAGPMILDTKSSPTEGERFFATATNAESQQPRSPLLLSPSLAATVAIATDAKDSTRKRLPSQLGPIKDMRAFTSPEPSVSPTAIGLGLDFGGNDENDKGVRRSKSFQFIQDDNVIVERAQVDVPASVSVLLDGTSPAPRLSTSSKGPGSVKLNVMSNVDKNTTSAVLSSPSFSSSLDAFSFNATPLSHTIRLPSAEELPQQTNPRSQPAEAQTVTEDLLSPDPADEGGASRSRWSSRLWSAAKGFATGGDYAGVLDKTERGNSPSPPMRPLTLLNTRPLSDGKRSHQRSRSHDGSREQTQQQTQSRKKKQSTLGPHNVVDLGSVSAPTSAILPPSPLFQSFGISHDDEPESTPRSPAPAALANDDKVDSRSKASRNVKRHSRIRYLPSGLEVRLEPTAQSDPTSPRSPSAAFTPKLADLMREEEQSFASPSSRRSSWRGPGGQPRGGSRLPYVPSPTPGDEDAGLLDSPSVDYAARRQSSPVIGSPWLGFEDEEEQDRAAQDEDEETRRRRVEEELKTARERLLAGQASPFPNPHLDTAAHRQKLLRNRSIMSTSTVRHRRAATETLSPPTATVAPLSWTSSRQGGEASTPSARVWLHKPSSPESPSQFDVYGRSRGHQKKNAIDIGHQNGHGGLKNKVGNPMVVFVPTSAIENHLLRMTGSHAQADERKRKRMVRRKVLTHHWWSSVLPSNTLMNTSAAKKRQSTWSEYGEGLLKSSKAVFHDGRPSRSMFLLGFMGMPWLWLIGGWYLDQWGEWPQPMEPLLLPEDYMIVKGLPPAPSKELPLVQWQAKARPEEEDEQSLMPRTPQNPRQPDQSESTLSPPSPVSKQPVSRFDDDEDEQGDAIVSRGPMRNDQPFSPKFLLRNRFSNVFRSGDASHGRFQSGGRLDVQRDKIPSTRQRKINQQNQIKPEQRPITVQLNYYLANPAKLYDAFEDSVYQSTCQIVAGCQQTVSNCQKLDPFVLANRILGLGSMVIAFALMAWAIYEVVQRY
ncbi:hypothetical protein FA10DRAFT_266127 [Acaromyces ingoldii]|uniref:Uncharacterized protein n=1 Tax=Acaromyces ingoldii TaxID=215250 RepID=A0A316YUJ2_9BASI|nr:hypothetical protein FA10DRAFT_266127 [Acaromyces ingoldii]PWN92348.1 hypothetical protein FA10DRAFT_266127 [Acaromyces ingoldii]